MWNTPETKTAVGKHVRGPASGRKPTLHLRANASLCLLFVNQNAIYHNGVMPVSGRTDDDAAVPFTWAFRLAVQLQIALQMFPFDHSCLG